VAADEARVTVTVAVDAATAFRIFTEDIDQWWRRGVRFRASGARRGVIRIEPGAGGRLFESIDTDAGQSVVEIGKTLVWEPPTLLVFTWRAQNFAPNESTEVEVQFRQRGSKTEVRLCHRGFASLRADHPVRHRQDGPNTIRMIGMWWKDQFDSMLSLDAAKPPGTRSSI
jgi:uncharacterized protein YndB with AHSA1/START domain